MLYRQNFRGGGADMGAGSSGMGSGNSGGKSGGGNDARDRGMGMAGKTGNYSSGPTGNDGGGNKFSGLTKNVLNPNVDFVGNTVFGPTQKYSGDGFFSGYRNLDPVTGQPLMGLAYLGDRIKSFASRLNPFSLIGGLVAGPIGSFIGRGISSLGALRDYDTLADYARGEFGLFQKPGVNIDKGRGSGLRPTGIMQNLQVNDIPTDMDLNDYEGYRDREYIESAPVNKGILDIIDYTDPNQRGMYP